MYNYSYEVGELDYIQYLERKTPQEVECWADGVTEQVIKLIKKNERPIEVIKVTYNIHEISLNFLIGACIGYLHLRSLSIGSHAYVLSPSSYPFLCELLRKSTSLQVLSLKLGVRGSAAFSNLCEALEGNKSLKCLNFTGTIFSDSRFDCLRFFNALKQLANLTSLSLRGAGISYESIVGVANLIKNNSTLLSLDLGFNSFGSTGLACLTEALSLNRCLTDLNIEHNNIDDYVLRSSSFGEFLKSNTSLCRLNLGGNRIGDSGVTLLAQALESNVNLEFLELEDNKMGELGVNALANALVKNFTLQALGLKKNNFSQLSRGKLLDALKINLTLFDIKIDDEFSSIVEDFFPRNRLMYIAVGLLHCLNRVLTEENFFEDENFLKLFYSKCDDFWKLLCQDKFPVSNENLARWKLSKEYDFSAVYDLLDALHSYFNRHLSVIFFVSTRGAIVWRSCFEIEVFPFGK